MIKELLYVSRPLRYWFDKISFGTAVRQDLLCGLKDRFSGKPMLVVGNGPSLNDTPLDDFIGVPSIGMNKIDLLFDRVKWRPDLILCINNLVVQQHQEYFTKSDIPVYVSWKSRWFVHRKIWRELNYFLSLTSREFAQDISKGVGSAGTVTYTALQFAYYMGANPVIIFGVDHSFAFKGRPVDLEKMEGPDANHFDPNYFEAGKKWAPPNLKLNELAYSFAKRAFEEDGRAVYDATIGGKLDIFQKISLEEARKLVGIA